MLFVDLDNIQLVNIYSRNAWQNHVALLLDNFVSKADLGEEIKFHFPTFAESC